MPNVIAGLNMDLGIDLESVIDPAVYQNLSNFILKYSLPIKHRKSHTIHIQGDLIGYQVARPQFYTPETRSRIHLNTAPIVGRLIIGNFRDESLRLREDISPERVESHRAILNAQASGKLVLERADIYEKYQDVLASLDLSDVDIRTHLQADNQIKLVTELGMTL
jgi:hypothetical protein